MSRVGNYPPLNDSNAANISLKGNTRYFCLFFFHSIAPQINHERGSLAASWGLALTTVEINMLMSYFFILLVAYI